MRHAVPLFLLLSAPIALAQEANPKLDEILARQRELEEKIKQLQNTVAVYPEDGGPPPKYLAVPRRATGPADPDLSAPIAGYSNKNFFLRDRHSWFVLVPKGRINVDAYVFPNRPPAGPGVIPNSTQDSARTALRNTVFIRRARIGLAGTIARGIDFRWEAEFASLPSVGQYATLTDASVVINYTPYIQLEAGQFYSPFTLENPTSENFTDFMEKSTVVRWAVPTSRDVGGMLLGAAPRNIVRYWFALADGTGQSFKNFDNRLSVQMRVVFAPLAILPKHADWMERLWIGGSFWWRTYDNVGLQQTPSTSAATALDLAPVTTQGGFGVFNSNYANGTDAAKNPIRSHLVPAGTTWKWALEANLPITHRYGIRAEYVQQAIDLHRYDDVNAVNATVTRSDGPFAHLDGWGAYVEAWAWIGGDINVDHPGLYALPHWNGYIRPKAPQWALMLAAKYEHVEFAITNLPNPGKLDPANGHYALDTVELGANFWVTRHSRLMANYLANYVGSGDPNFAAGNSAKNLFFQKWEHELLFRLQVNL
jgi:hypothetical protein